MNDRQWRRGRGQVRSAVALWIVLAMGLAAGPAWGSGAWSAGQAPPDGTRPQEQVVQVAQAGGPGVAAVPESTLWNQPLHSVDWSAWANQDFSDQPDYSVFLADDVINSVPWKINSIYVPGNVWNGGETLLNASTLHWLIYDDAGGVPAGDPAGGGAAPVWSLALPPGDPQVVLSAGASGYMSDVTLTLATPLVLPAGHWWFVFYPTMDFSSYGQYGRHRSSTANGYVSQFINPGGAWGYGTAWQSWYGFGDTPPASPDMAFRLDGTTGFVVNSTGDAADSSTADGLCATSGGQCTLRAAIQQANADGQGAISFTGLPAGSTIAVNATGLGGLPALQVPIAIDGTTADGGWVELDGSLVSSGNGLKIDADGCTVKGLVINRFGSTGVEIVGSNNLVQGNRIGTNASGTAGMGNDGPGVWIDGSTAPAQGNTLRGNLIGDNAAYGVYVYGVYASDNVIEGNRIGTDLRGEVAIPNLGPGVALWDAPDNRVGGTTTAQRNVISGNDSHGITIEGSATGNVVQGNYVGMEVDGADALPNGGDGIHVEGPANTIGGTAGTALGWRCRGACNLVTGNVGNGIAVQGTGNVVQGNYVGTDAWGGPWGNSMHGIELSGPDASGNLIGGTTVGDGQPGNLLVGNLGHGVTISGEPADGNTVVGNWIADNGMLGIDLGADLVTANDAGDGDTGPNQLQNYPVLSWVTTGPTVISGTLDSTPSTAFRVEFFYSQTCDPSGNGEGERFFGTADVTTAPDGSAAISVTLPVTVPAGSFVTATATDPAGNTSEFSPCRIAIPAIQLDLGPGLGGQLTYTHTQALTTTVIVPPGAVSETIILGLLPLPLPSHPPLLGLRASHLPFDLGAYQGNSELPDYEFSLPLTFTIHYADADIYGIDEEDLALYYWNETDKTWSDAADTCSPPSTYVHDLDANRLEVAICHLSEWNIQGPDMIGWTLHLPLVARGNGRALTRGR